MGVKSRPRGEEEKWGCNLGLGEQEINEGEIQAQESRGEKWGCNQPLTDFFSFRANLEQEAVADRFDRSNTSKCDSGQTWTLT